MSMYYFNSIFRHKWRMTSEHLVKTCTKAIQVTALINYSIYSASLLWTTIVDCAQELSWHTQTIIARHVARRKLKIDKTYRVIAFINENIGWVHIPVNNPSMMNIIENITYLDCDRQKLSDINIVWVDYLFEWRTVKIFHFQCMLIFNTRFT